MACQTGAKAREYELAMLYEQLCRKTLANRTKRAYLLHRTQRSDVARYGIRNAQCQIMKLTCWPHSLSQSLRLALWSHGIALSLIAIVAAKRAPMACAMNAAKRAVPLVWERANMATFCFCLTIGVDGYLPDQQDYVRADCSIDAYDAIVEAIRDFRDNGDDSGDTSAFTEHSWRTFFERGCSYIDASQWSFALADHGKLTLSLTGLTNAEYALHSEGE